jgi:predicted negative regulator of RcsB-dependent stress response
VAQKKPAEARAAYKSALEKAEPGAMREAVRLKLEALGEG